MENRIRDFHDRLSAVENGLEQLIEVKQRLETEAQALRQQMTVMSLATVMDLAQGALKKAELRSSSNSDSEKLRIIQRRLRNTEEPSDSACMAAYDFLRSMHVDCP